MKFSLEYANRGLYRAARKRDRTLWITGAWLAFRDALLAGRDGQAEWDELMRRDRVLSGVEEEES